MRSPDQEQPEHDSTRSRGWGRGKIATIVVAAGLAILVVWGYARGREESRRDAEMSVVAPSRTRLVNGETAVEIGSAARARGGIVIAPAPVGGSAGVTGYGRVIPLDTLAALHNEYIAAQSAAAQARARTDASRREYDRLATLHADEQNVSARAVEEARAAMLADQATLASAGAPVRTLAAVARQNWGPVVGDWITHGSAELARLMAGREVLVQVTVPSGVDVSGLPPRCARLETGPGTAVDARYVSTAARTDPAVQGPSFYYVAPSSPALIPGMNVKALLAGGSSAGRDDASGAAIPDSAIVWTDGSPWVYVQLDSNTFVRRRIAVGVPAADGGSFVTTIAPGTPIVVRGAQVLLSEELRSRIQGSSDGEES
jgi:hypothetical protein